MNRNQGHFLNELEMKFWDVLKEHRPRAILLAFSGGLDSGAGAKLLNSIQSRYSVPVRLCYVHHGESSEARQMEYRNTALEFSREVASKYNYEFVSNYPDNLPKQELSSEEEFRDYRLEVLSSFVKEDEWICFCQHEDDLLETRLLRLIRGTGPEGLKSMDVLYEKTFRPLLVFTRSELEKYVSDKEIHYIDDPSNGNTKYLRNWVRNEWLPQLEARQKGAVDSLGRSLANLAGYFEEAAWVQDYITGNAVDRSKLLCLSKEKQLQVFATFLYQKGHRNFKKSQLVELLKRLDSEQNNLTFRVMGLDWVVEPSKVYIS